MCVSRVCRFFQSELESYPSVNQHQQLWIGVSRRRLIIPPVGMLLLLISPHTQTNVEGKFFATKKICCLLTYWTRFKVKENQTVLRTCASYSMRDVYQMLPEMFQQHCVKFLWSFWCASLNLSSFQDINSQPRYTMFVVSLSVSLSPPSQIPLT